MGPLINARSTERLLVLGILLVLSSRGGWKVSSTFGNYYSSCCSCNEPPLPTADHHDPRLQEMMISPPPPLCSKAEATWQECIPDDPPTIDVILTLWKRRALHFQLNSLASQSFKPSHTYIVQSNNFLDSEFIQKSLRGFSETTNQSIPIDIIHSSADQRYHGRFHLAYALSNATYVSIWDDDVFAEPGYLEYSVNYSRAHKDTLVGGDGRIFKRIMGLGGTKTKNFAIQRTARQNGFPVDFASNAWTLRRDFIRYYLGSTVYTYETGEDTLLHCRSAGSK